MLLFGSHLLEAQIVQPKTEELRQQHTHKLTQLLANCCIYFTVTVGQQISMIIEEKFYSNLLKFYWKRNARGSVRTRRWNKKRWTNICIGCFRNWAVILRNIEWWFIYHVAELIIYCEWTEKEVWIKEHTHQQKWRTGNTKPKHLIVLKYLQRNDRIFFDLYFVGINIRNRNE